MTHETAPTQSLVDDALNELENQADEYDSIHAGEGDLLRSAAELIRQQQALIAQQAAPVAAPTPPAQQPVAWVTVSERLPESGRTVLATYQNPFGKVRRIRAEYIAAKAREASADYDSDVEYDEETDASYWPAGWYECVDNWDEYSHIAVVEGEVTHWMPLPSAPGDIAAPEQAARPCTCFSDLQAKHCPRKCIGWHEGEPKQANHKAALEDIAAVLRQSPEWGADQLDEIVAILSREGFPVSE